jgi:predicted dehydrogenase
MEEMVRLLAEKRLHVAPLVTHRFPIEDGVRAYELITGKGQEPYLGIVLTFGAEAPVTRMVESRSAVVGVGAPAIGVLGAGDYAGKVLLPIIAASRAELAGIASPSGLRAQAYAKKFGFRFSASEENQVLEDSRTGAVVVLTRHDLHARQVIAALSRGKHVFVEKPLCLDEDELARIIEARRAAGDRLVEVGFNRRHAPYTRALLEFFSGVAAPRTVAIRVNAGPLPPDHWLLDPKTGGGRLVGEGCHFIDWAGRVVGESAVEADCRPLGPLPGEQDWLLRLRYPGGSVAEILYTSQAAPTLGKERYEVHSGGRSAVLEDFRILRLYGAGRRRSRRSWLRADKGQRAQWAAFLSAVKGDGPPPTPWEDTVGTMRTVFAARASLRQGRVTEVQA